MRLALCQIYPRRLEVPLLLAGTVLLLWYSYTQPFMETDRWVFFTREHSLMGSIRHMWDDGYCVIATIVFTFSVVFPLAKLGALTMVWFTPLTHFTRKRFMHLTASLGRWSMLDVFVVAMLVVLIRATALLSARPRHGIYIFAAAILLSMVVSLWIEYLARHVPDEARSESH